MTNEEVTGAIVWAAVRLSELDARRLDAEALVRNAAKQRDDALVKLMAIEEQLRVAQSMHREQLQTIRDMQAKWEQQNELMRELKRENIALRRRPIGSARKRRP